MLTISADSKDVAVLIRYQLRQHLHDNSAAPTNVTLGYLLDEVTQPPTHRHTGHLNPPRSADASHQRGKAVPYRPEEHHGDGANPPYADIVNGREHPAPLPAGRGPVRGAGLSALTRTITACLTKD